MCPEFERVERIVQLMVDGSEKVWARRYNHHVEGYRSDVRVDITIVGIGCHGSL